MGIVHDRAGRDAELVAAAPATPAVILPEIVNVHVAAPEAGNTSRPAKRLQVVAALFVVAETVDQLHKVHSHGSGSMEGGKAA